MYGPWPDPLRESSLQQTRSTSWTDTRPSESSPWHRAGEWHQVRLQQRRIPIERRPLLSARDFRATGRTAGQEGEMHIRTIRVILKGEGPSDINRRSHDRRSQG
jgi:hypothetical protein